MRIKFIDRIREKKQRRKEEEELLKMLKKVAAFYESGDGIWRLEISNNFNNPKTIEKLKNWLLKN